MQCTKVSEDTNKQLFIKQYLTINLAGGRSVRSEDERLVLET